MSRPNISIIYAYYEKDDKYRTNMIYFLKFAYFKDPLIDYTFVINGTHTVNFPQESNVKVIQRDNTGFDFQGYYYGLLSLRKRYKYYIFINSSVRGPYMPPYMSPYLKWYDPFLHLLQTDMKVKLVGSTINIQPPAEYFKLTQFTPHVQSYCFAMDAECLEYLMTTQLFQQEYENKLDVIIHQEFAMSTLVLQNGWNISCLVPEYQGLNYHDKTFPTKLIDDILWTKNSLGRVIHPYEIIFTKTDRGISTNEIDTLTHHFLNLDDMCFAGDKNVNIAICFHLGYGNMYPQFSNYIKNVYRTGYNVDLYVTYQKKSDPIDLIKKDYPEAIFLHTLKGCDTGAFLIQLDYIYKNELKHQKHYDYIFKIHTKKKEDWRLELLESIAGTPQEIMKICDLFKHEPEIGMISGCQKWIRHHDKINEPLINDICHRLRVEINKNSCFIGGTIFWTRWPLLRKFISEHAIDLKKEYDKCELGYLINDVPTYTHSWERIFGYIMGHNDQKIISITSIDPKPCTEMSRGKHLVIKVLYGLSETEAIDVTDLIRKSGRLYLRNINTNSLWGDPYVEKKKKLFIYFNTDQVFILNEFASQLTPNNFILQCETINGIDEIIFKLEDNNNLENYITLKSNEQLGQYVTTFFDCGYYYDTYAPWLASRQYDDCLQHYMKYGLESNLMTFNVGENLLHKYGIKLMAYYVPYYNPIMKYWKPVYRNHQVKIPAETYQPYDPATLSRNIELARAHGITGFCFQHYWEHGCKLYHETAELFVSNKTCHMSFCFSWITSTTSSDRNDWISHFQYLLPFFKNNNYVKFDEKPIFLLNSLAENPVFCDCWNQLATEAGFRGIFFISCLETYQNHETYLNPVTEINPSYLINRDPSLLNKRKTYSVIDYCRACHSMCNQKQTTPAYFREIFTGYDNTPNPTAKNKIVCIQTTPNAVACALKAQLENILENTISPFNLVFIHSWNDWENQMVLEPDKTSNIDALIAINNVVHQYSNPQIYNKSPDLFL